MIKKHKPIPEGLHTLKITEVSTMPNIYGVDIINIKFYDPESKCYTLLNIDLTDDMYGINRSRSLLHALNIKFDKVTPELLESLVGYEVLCEVFHKPYKADPDIKIARLKFL